MARFTFIRQDAQYSSDLYDDTIAAGAALETAALTSEDDFNGLRSQVQRAIGITNWWDALVAPSALEAGSARGIQPLNEALHLLEKKRVLRDVHNLTDVTVGAGNNFVILGTGELPAQTTAAVGAVTTLGTVVAPHGGTFGTHSLAEITGSNALKPLNLMEVVDGSSRDPILSDGRKVWGLLQGESGVTDGATITDATTTRVQISFVRINATGDDLEAVPVADIENAVINYCTRERVRLEDLTEGDFLKGAIIDVAGASSAVSRKDVYDNQGVTPVEQVTNATLDLATGLFWEIRDNLNATLFRVTEGSAGGTSVVQVASDVDTFDVDAAVNDFANGVSVGTSGTPIQVGVVAGEITRAADLTFRATGAGEILFDDSNRGGSGFGVDLKLSDTSTEWDDFEAAFGEVSLLNALVQAGNASPAIRKTSAQVTANTAADTDVGGVGGGANLDAQIHDLSGGDFVQDHDVYLNGQLLRGGANAAANFDYYPGSSLVNGQLSFEFQVRGTGSKKDTITVISRA